MSEMSAEDMAEALRVALEASGAGQWCVSGAKGGARALLGRALLQEHARADAAERDLAEMREARDRIAVEVDWLWAQVRG